MYNHIIGKMHNTPMFYMYLLMFSLNCRLSITHNGIHNGGRAAEGRPPTIVEAAEGRLHYG